MNEKRIFPLNNGLSLDDIVLLLEQYLSVQKSLTTQKFNLGNKVIMQCVDSAATLTQLVGLNAAVTIELEQINNTLSVTIGNSKWLDKVGTAAFGALFFSPLVVAAGIGAVRQAVLPTEIFTFLEGKTGKSSSNIGNAFSNLFNNTPFNTPFSNPAPAEAESVICPCCGNQVNKDHAFCSKCGTKL